MNRGTFLLFFISFTINMAWGGVGTPVKNIPRVIDTMQKSPEPVSIPLNKTTNRENTPSPVVTGQNQPAPIPNPSGPAASHKNNFLLWLIGIIIIMIIIVTALIIKTRIQKKE